MPSRTLDTKNSTKPSDCENENDARTVGDLLTDLDMSDLIAGEESVDEVIEALDALDATVDDSAGSGFTDLSKEARDFDKSVKTDRYISVFRDAQFLRDFKTLTETTTMTPGDTPLLVIEALSKTLPLPRHTSGASSSSHTSSYNPWWHESERPQLPSPARQYRTPAPWRDTSDHLKVTFRHIALQTLAPVHTLNLNLSPDIEAVAREQEYPLGWIQKRISHHLKETLGRSVEFHLVAHEGKDHRLHVHGEFQIDAVEAREARGALRKAGGTWDKDALQKQAWTHPSPDLGWVNYLVGELWRVGLTQNILPGLTLADPSRVPNSAFTFEGGATSSTAGLNALAKAIYEECRQTIRVEK
jgi:hypothetical protein